MKVYSVYHDYDTDGGFGDAISQRELLATFESKEDADTYIAKYENPHIYERPYAGLECGVLTLEEVEVISHDDFDFDEEPKDIWWKN